MKIALSARLALLAGLLLPPLVADAYIVNITAQNPRAVYLRVGDGSMNGGSYANGGTPAINTTVNRVQVTVPAAQVGNGTPQVMGTEGNPRVISDWDGFAFCNAGQIYIGGFYRRTGGGNQSARLSVTAPATLTAAGGNSIPISQISWTTSGNGDTVAQPVSNHTLSAGLNNLDLYPQNTWRESCLTFRYANQQVVAAGTYDARLVFTISSP